MTDLATGHLRLTAAQFAALVEESTDLMLEPVRTPVCRVLVEVAGVGGSHLHQGWVDQKTAAFLLYTRDDLYDFLTTGPSFTPAVIARLLRLGPGGPPGGTELSCRTATLEALFDEDPAIRDGAVRDVAGAMQGWLAGRVVVGWDGPDGEPDGRDLTLLRTDRLRVAEYPDPAADAVVWTPVTSTEIWRAVISLLPGDDELTG